MKGNKKIMKISITNEMYDETKDLPYESQVKLIMAYTTYFFRGNIESFDFTELEQYIFNKWIDDELSRDKYTNLRTTL
jgi:hypothetical protein